MEVERGLPIVPRCLDLGTNAEFQFIEPYKKDPLVRPLWVTMRNHDTPDPFADEIPQSLGIHSTNLTQAL
jgi:hypothetical protein